MCNGCGIVEVGIDFGMCVCDDVVVNLGILYVGVEVVWCGVIDVGL